MFVLGGLEPDLFTSFIDSKFYLEEESFVSFCFISSVVLLLTVCYST